MELTNLIPDLLYKHNCVILPGFGGFIANFKATEHQQERFLISPARKIVAFNQSLVENDGLLISSLAKSKKIAYPEAEKEVTAYIDFIQSRLEKYKNFEFKHVGTFYLNSEDKLLFVPYQGLNFLERSFGLPDVKVKPLFDHVPQPVGKPQKAKVVRLPKERKTRTASAFKVAAAVIILLMVGGFATMHLNENRSLDRISGLQLPSDHLKDSHEASAASIFPVETSDIDDTSSAEDLHPEEEVEFVEEGNHETEEQETAVAVDLPVVDDEPEQKPATPIIRDKKVEPIDNTSSESSKELFANYKSLMAQRNYFHVIIGEFDSEQEALKWQRRYQKKAYSADIITDYKVGKFHISLEHFTKEEHAIAFQREVRISERRRTWIAELKRK